MNTTNVAAVRGRTDCIPVRRGRPRRSGVATSVLGATLDMLSECGFAGLSVEQLADQVGVAKTTIYRRWNSKTDLVIDAIELLRSKSPVPDTGDVWADLESGLANMLSAFTSRHGRAIASVYAARLHNEQLAVAWHEKIGEPHHTAFAHLVERAAAAGQLRSDLTIDEVVTLVTGPAFMVLLNTGSARPNLARDVVAALRNGLDGVNES